MFCFIAGIVFAMADINKAGVEAMRKYGEWDDTDHHLERFKTGYNGEE